jgi:hypothetical protein
MCKVQDRNTRRGYDRKHVGANFDQPHGLLLSNVQNVEINRASHGRKNNRPSVGRNRQIDVALSLCAFRINVDKGKLPRVFSSQFYPKAAQI